MLTQLCLAVALLALHMESWLTVVPDLINNLTTPPEQAVVKLPCLLELLTVLPEEVENFKVGIMPRRRQEFRKMLKEAGVQAAACSPQCDDHAAWARALLADYGVPLLVVAAPWPSEGRP